MHELTEQMARFFTERHQAEQEAKAAGRAQRDEAARWCRTEVVPAFNVATTLVQLGGRSAKPKVDLVENTDTNAEFPVTVNGRAEFRYKLRTLTSPDGPMFRVETGAADSKYSAPTPIAGVTESDILDDLLQTYKDSLESIPPVL